MYIELSLNIYNLHALKCIFEHNMVIKYYSNLFTTVSMP